MLLYPSSYVTYSASDCLWLYAIKKLIDPNNGLFHGLKDKTVLCSEVCLVLDFEDSMLHYGLRFEIFFIHVYSYSSSSDTIYEPYFFSCSVQYLIGFVFVRSER